jgi:hypothetical protein
MSRKTGAGVNKGGRIRRSKHDPKNAPGGALPEHDQDSDPPRTALTSDDPRFAGQSAGPEHDQDSDPPRTAVPPPHRS